MLQCMLVSRIYNLKTLIVINLFIINLKQLKMIMLYNLLVLLNLTDVWAKFPSFQDLNPSFRIPGLEYGTCIFFIFRYIISPVPCFFLAIKLGKMKFLKKKTIEFVFAPLK